MCGIAAICGDREPIRVAALVDRMRHRGPDSAGFYSRGRIHLGASRLRIVDIGGDDQPIRNAASDRAIVFNGEIYNHRALRHALQQRGHVFTTGGDTEVILHLYEQYGADCVHHLQGMFAFVIADGETLFAARDRLGIKPLFYSTDGEGADRSVMFASEPAPLLRHRRGRAEFDWPAVLEGLLLGHPLGNRTYFRGIHTLEPGCTMRVTRRNGDIAVEKRRYYNLPPVEPDPSMSFDEARRALEHLLCEIVTAHADADVDIGLLLSGGLDSGLLAAVSCAVGSRPVRTFTIGDSAFHPDVLTARLVAERLALRHTVMVPSPQEFIAAIPRCIAVMGALHHLGGLPALLLCQAVQRRGIKSCLCGEGSDEVFGGYRDFTKKVGPLHSLRTRLTQFAAAGFVPSDDVFALVDSLDAARTRGSDADLRAVFSYHQRHGLVFNHLEMFDRLGMAAGVEIRVPFVDHRLVEFANRLPLEYKVKRSEGTGKYILRALAKQSHEHVLAEAVRRPKLGMPTAALAPVRKFEALCDGILPADYRSRHDLGPCVPTNTKLVLFELFEEIFLRHAGEMPPDLDVIDFVRSRAAAAAARSSRSRVQHLEAS